MNVVMSLLLHLSVFGDGLTQFSTDSSAEVSQALLLISAVTMGAAGLGLVILCARALLASRRRRRPTEPWVSEALSSPTLHTRAYEEPAARPTTEPIRTYERTRPSEPPQPVPSAGQSEPLSEPIPPTVRRPEIVPPPPVSANDAAEPPPSAVAGPSSTDPTVEMDLSAFPEHLRAMSERPDLDVAPPSEPTDTEVFGAEPIPLVAKVPSAAPAETEEEPPTVHRSGTAFRVPDEAYLRSMATAGDRARRA